MGSTKIVQQTPAPPPASVVQPSVSSSIQDYVNALPQLMQAQLNFAPQEAAQQLQLLQQYGAPLGQALRNAQEATNPGITGLQDSLVQQARSGAENGLTDQLKNLYADQFKALAGANVNAGSGADYVGKNLLQQDLSYRQFNQNLGLSLAGMQPIAQPFAPTTTNQMSQFSPGQALGFNQGIYGTQMGYYKPQMFQQQSPFVNTLGAVAGGLQGLGQMKSLFTP